MTKRFFATVAVALFIASACDIDSSDTHPAAFEEPKAERTELKTIAVKAYYKEPPGTPNGASCRIVTPDCKARYEGWAYFTGTFTGEAYYDLLGWVQPDGKIRYEGPDYVTGTIKGCGTGTFILDEPYGEVDMTKFDPVTQSAPGYNTWRVRPGSGTGGLEGLVSGSGVNHWRAYPFEQDPVARRFGKGTFTGTVKCRVPVR